MPVTWSYQVSKIFVQSLVFLVDLVETSLRSGFWRGSLDTIRKPGKNIKDICDEMDLTGFALSMLYWGRTRTMHLMQWSTKRNQLFPLPFCDQKDVHSRPS